MASACQKIDAAQSGWLDPLNQMLKAYGESTADSGWIPITLVNGFTNQGTRIRSIGKVVFLQIAMTDLTINTTAAWLPKSLVIPGGLTTLIRTTSGASFGITIRDDGMLYVEYSVTRTTDQKDYISGLLVWPLN